MVFLELKNSKKLLDHLEKKGFQITKSKKSFSKFQSIEIRKNGKLKLKIELKKCQEIIDNPSRFRLDPEDKNYPLFIMS
jgi:hypothetical protein